MKKDIWRITKVLYQHTWLVSFDMKSFNSEISLVNLSVVDHNPLFGVSVIPWMLKSIALYCLLFDINKITPAL